MKHLKIKVCGMRETSNIQEIASLKPDLMGFVFHPASPRYAGNVPGERMFANFPEGIVKTGVFVNESADLMLNHVQSFGLHAVQLHGDESPDICNMLRSRGLLVIKAFGIAGDLDPSKMKPYISCSDYLLFDTSSRVPGGSGESFNWDLLDNYDLEHPFFLSGGINPGDMEKIREIKNPALYGIDINSKFELEPGLKDFDRVKDFLDSLRSG